MDFGLTEEEEMVVESAATFADVALRPHERAHEETGEVSAAARTAFAETGLGELGSDDPELEVSWPARVQAVAALAKGDGAACLSLWTSAWLPAAAQTLGVEIKPDQIQWAADFGQVAWPLPCLPLPPGSSHVLLVDRTGTWGRGACPAHPDSESGARRGHPLAVRS